MSSEKRHLNYGTKETNLFHIRPTIEKKENKEEKHKNKLKASNR